LPAYYTVGLFFYARLVGLGKITISPVIVKTLVIRTVSFSCRYHNNYACKDFPAGL